MTHVTRDHIKRSESNTPNNNTSLSLENNTTTTASSNGNVNLQVFLLKIRLHPLTFAQLVLQGLQRSPTSDVSAVDFAQLNVHR